MLFFYMYGVYNICINYAFFLDVLEVFMSQSTHSKDHNVKKKDHQESDASPLPEKDESLNTTQTDVPKTKSYAEIIKGFEEIDKIFKRQKEKDK